VTPVEELFVTKRKIGHDLASGGVTGSLQDAADFPLLAVLDVSDIKVAAEIRDIGPNDFLSLKELGLGQDSYGDLRSMQEAPGFMFARYQSLKRFPGVFKQSRWSLADDSPANHEIHGRHSRRPPYHVEFAKAGPRLGWRWTNCVIGGCCETHWLDSEPTPFDERYEEYYKTT
jgi:hypothetical protein